MLLCRHPHLPVVSMEKMFTTTLPRKPTYSRLGRVFILGLLAFFFSCLAPASISAAEFSGRIVGVLDGDTVDVLSNDKTLVRIRIAGIDAPEKTQAFGQRAKRALSDLAFGKSVNVFWKKHDKYNRVIGKIEVDDVDLGLAMIQLGFAWHFQKYEREQTRQDRTLYRAAEVAARSARLGLWADESPVPPWEFRKFPSTKARP